MKKLILLNIILSFLVINWANLSLAAVQLDSQLKPEYAAAYNTNSLGPSDYINYILQVFAGGLIYIAGPLAVLMLVWGGSSYVTSRGEQGATDKAKKTIIYAIAGLIVIMLSYAIVFNVIAMLNSTGG